MNRLIVLASFIVAACSFLNAQSRPRPLPGIARSVSKAYVNGLSGLDAKRLRRGGVKVVFENTGGDIGTPEFEVKRFPTFNAMERWLRSQVHEDGTPFRATGRFTGCRKQQCVFASDHGILHNHLYLKKILFGSYNGKPYVKEIHILVG